jgi:Flp pilus assembly pilin Flp
MGAGGHRLPSPKASARPHHVVNRARQAGQAMIEYAIVLAFGVIILIQGGDSAPVKQLATAIKDYHEHYSYAMAIAYIPECDYSLAYDKSAGSADIATLTGGIAVGFDRCIDWQNPTVPSLAVSGSLVFDMVPDVKAAIEKIISDAVTDSITNFLSPGNFMKTISFSPADFF